MELIVVLFVLSCISLMSFKLTDNLTQEKYLTFFDHYLYLQSESLLKNEARDVDEGIHFNSAGNINHAQTITFENNKAFILELGGGRIVEKEWNHLD
ncbi:MAG: hypothetical protein J6D29_08160 [Solobacterium sp.]|nr:hypothetical protein [Solobacterium sp.]